MKEKLIKELLEAVASLHTFFWEQEEPRDCKLGYEIGEVVTIARLLSEVSVNDKSPEDKGKGKKAK